MQPSHTGAVENRSAQHPRSWKGEARIGDFKEIGMVRRRYRSGLDRLEKYGLIATTLKSATEQLFTTRRQAVRRVMTAGNQSSASPQLCRLRVAAKRKVAVQLDGHFPKGLRLLSTTLSRLALDVAPHESETRQRTAEQHGGRSTIWDTRCAGQTEDVNVRDTRGLAAGIVRRKHGRASVRELICSHEIEVTALRTTFDVSAEERISKAHPSDRGTVIIVVGDGETITVCVTRKTGKQVGLIVPILEKCQGGGWAIWLNVDRRLVEHEMSVCCS